MSNLRSPAIESAELSGEATSAPASSIKSDYLAEVISLSAAQLEAAMKFATHEEAKCTDSLLRGIAHINDARRELNKSFVDADGVDRSILSKLDGTLGHVSEDANAAITALQYVDALSQRLSHILFELNQVAKFADSGRNLDSIDDWAELLNRIRTMYSIHEEREVFDAAMADAAIGALIGARDIDSDFTDNSVDIF